MNKKFVWQSLYPQNIPTEIIIDENENILTLLKRTVEKNHKNIAFTNMGKNLSFSKLEDLSNRFATFLQNHSSLKQGDGVAIQLPNLLQYPVVFFGIIKAGMVVINTNPLYTERELEFQYKDSGAKALIVLENFADKIENIIQNTNIDTVIITKIGDMLGGVKGNLVNSVVKYVKKMIPKHNLQGISFKSALKKGKKTKYIPIQLKGENIALLQYTGGTTGVSKAAILSHKNIVSNVKQAQEWIKPFLNANNQSTVITPLPLYHIFSLTVNCLFLFSMGCKNVLITNPRDLKVFIKEMKKHKFAMITGVNTLFNALLTQKKFKELDFSELKISCGGGMAVQDYVAKKWEEVTGCPLIEGYGLSETSPILTFNPLNGNHKTGSIGIPLPSTELDIQDENGISLPPGTVGEICCKGPQVMRGYWKNKNETDKVLKNNWFYTGDMGIMHENGLFEIVDRKKDMINVSGFNVFPLEIENVVSELECVLEVAAVGVHDDKTSEAIKLFIVKKNADCTEETILTHCKKHLTGYKCPKYIEFREELPKSNVGKILKKELREN